MGCPVTHFEIGCRDREKTGAFYSTLFGWRTEPYGPRAPHLQTDSDRGIGGQLTALGHEPHNYVMMYVEVADVGRAIEKAKELGGRAIVGPIALPTGGQFAWIADPEGTMVGLLSAKPS
jgi:hypothetical protein